MFKLFAEWVCLYYANNKMDILCNIWLILAILACYIDLKRKGKWTYSRVDWFRISKYGIFVLWIKYAVQILNIEIELNLPFSNVAFFVVSIYSILIFEVIQGVILRKLKVPVLQTCKYFRMVIRLGIYFLTAIRCLNILDIVGGVLSLICLDMLPMLLSAMDEKKDQNISKISDYPNADLFYEREIQLDRFLQVLNDLKKEPYAILISGEWGTGKTSFIKAMERKLDNDVFIWLYAGSEKSISEIMQEVSNSIINVLKRNKIIIENTWMIEKYFLSFVDAWDEKRGKLIRSIVDMFINEEPVDDKEFLNEKLKELNKTVYLIVDDLDRCTSEYQDRMFKALRESIELENCKVLFLVDDKKFLQNDRNYIEKYASFTLNLCEVPYEELVSYFIDEILDDRFMEQIDDILLNGRTGREIKKIIFEYNANLMNKFEEERTNDRESEEDERYIINAMDNIKRNSKNVRKVKNFLKGVKYDIKNLNAQLKKCSKIYQQEDWISAAIEIQFLKYMLPDLYNEIRVNDFRKITETDSRKSIIEIIFGIEDDSIKRDILNYIMYEIDTMDTHEIITDKEKYINELKTSPQINHVRKYLSCTEEYEEFIEIMKLCKTTEFKNMWERENFVKELLDKFSKI